MTKPGFSIKNTLTLLTVTISLSVTVFLASVSFIVSQSYVRQNLLQTTEFNLQLISNTISQYISAINTFGSWISFNSSIALWCENPHHTDLDAVTVYNRVREEFQHNKANTYIRRLIITDTSQSKFIQIGSSLTESEPVTVYSLHKLPLAAQSWRVLSTDPLDLLRRDELYGKSQIFPLVFPVFRSGSSTVIGYVYMSIDSSIISSSFQNYPPMQKGSVYLTAGSSVFAINEKSFIPYNSLFDGKKIDSYYKAKQDETLITTLRSSEGTQTFVSYPLEGMLITERLSKQSFVDQQAIFFKLLAGIFLGIMLMGIGIWISLYRMITVPVSKIRTQLSIIESGSFTHNPCIEWRNEMGDIGRSINSLSKNIDLLMNKRISDEKSKRLLEYKILQGQINPHFLYNTLNSIRWMAEIQKAEGIAEMTMSLARLLKNIAKDSDTIIPLENELALLDDYFLIQQYRYGGAISLVKNIDSDVLKTGIPRFSLQPLIENAIFHGIESTGKSGRIEISAKKASVQNTSVVQITLTDNGIGMTEEEIRTIFEGAGKDEDGLFKNVGILNVHKRIKYEFGSDYGLGIVSEKGKYTTITIEVPDTNV
jgi:two-component system sensor histidine kinase YesM